MTHLLRASFVLLTALVFTPAAYAGPIVFFDTYRTLEANGTFFENSSSSGSWSVFTSSPGISAPRHQASHFSDVGSLRFDPAGHAETFTRVNTNLSGFSFSSGDGPLELRSTFVTWFELDSDYFATLDGHTGFSNQFVSGNAQTRTYLYDAINDAILAESINGAGRVDFQGVLGPGIYSLFSMAEITAASGPYQEHVNTGTDFTLQAFTPVPEPATMTLFGVGLAAAAWRRRTLSR